MTISMNREDLLNSLRERLEAAKAEDRRAAEKHKKDEQAALERFRDKLRKALTWNYHDAKNAGRVSLDRPSCPMLQANRISEVIRMVKMDTRKRSFAVREHSDLHAAITWTPESESRKHKNTVCD